VKERRRNHDFHYMMRYIRKGENGSLRMIQIKDNKDNIIKALTNWYDIENAIIDFNKSNFQQTHHTKVYNDKIYEQLKVDEVQDKVLKGKISREDNNDEKDLQISVIIKTARALGKAGRF